MKTALLSSLTVMLSILPAVAATDIVIADFEGDDYGQWQTTGTAFGTGPAHGTLPDQMNVSGFLGRGLVNSYVGGDKSQGTLTSPEFKIERKYINFLIGGGCHPGETCINLLIDGKVALTATPRDNEHLDPFTWDVSPFAGKTARIEIVDRNTGGWGHVNIDQIVQSDSKTAAVIVPEPLYHETYRPQFHFSPKINWTNDPNGMVFYKGEYHLFFQHNPSGINWGNMTWGHAVSPDLLHWEQLPNAIEPDKLGTIFSGSAVVDWDNTAGFQKGDEKTLVAIYTAAGGTSPESKGQPFTQCIAYSNDRGRTWTKYDQNPVLKHIVKENRDPKVVWHAPTRKWIMALYKDGNTFTFYSSPDLKSWTHLHDFDAPDCGECPDFFEIPVDGKKDQTKWVWTAANGRYLVGSFDGNRFTYEGKPLRVDFGKNYYAVQSYSDIPASDGRRIQIAWMNGASYPNMPFNQQMSFPCELQLHTFPEGIRMARMPVKEIEKIRAKEHKWADKPLTPGDNLLSGISGDLFDIQAEIEPGEAKEVGFRIRGEAATYSAQDHKLSCLGADAPLDLLNGRIKLRILVDRTTIEVFGNDGRVSLTSCFLPHPDKKQLETFATGSAARLVSMEVYELRSTWPANQ